MLKKLALLIITAALIISIPTNVSTMYNETDDFLLIAHAGGLIGNYYGTNSLEALKSSAELGYKYIEVDIITTTDNRFVLAHDWEYMSNRVPLAPDLPVDCNVFTEYKINNKYTPLTLELLLNFLDENEGVYIITDTKYMDYSSLEFIAHEYPEYKERIVPQVYLFDDYEYVKGLGYEKIIVTIYAMPYEIKSSPQTIAAKAKELGVFAITIPETLLDDEEFVRLLELDKINYFTHTVNSTQRAAELFNMGIKGIYTDTIKPFSENSMLENISKFDKDYANDIEQLNNRISQLTSSERRLLSETIIYELNEEIMLNKGVAEFIYNNTMITCFISNDSEKVYIPLYKTAEFLGAKDFLFENTDRIYRFYYSGQNYEIPINSTYENEERLLAIFGDAIFAHERIFEDIFDCEIIKTVTTNQFIIITKQGTGSENDYAKIIEKLFKTE